MANKKNARANGSAVETTETGEMVVTIPIADIDTSFENQRTGDWSKGDSKESADGNSFKELKVSIRETGQQEPVLVRPFKGKGVKRFQLVAGFRRLLAIKENAADAGNAKSATIKAIVREMTDLQAFEAHVLENTARDNLTGPDLAFAAYNLGEKYRAAGTTLSGAAIAARIGKNQSYISSLLRIVGGAPKVAKMWREAPIQLSINEMTKIAKLKDPAEQEKTYNDLLKKAEDTSGSGPGGKDWVASASERAQKAARLIGSLEREGMIGKVDITWSEALPLLGVKLKSDTTADQKKAVGKAAREAYAEAKKAQSKEESDAASE